MNDNFTTVNYCARDLHVHYFVNQKRILAIVPKPKIGIEKDAMLRCR